MNSEVGIKMKQTNQYENQETRVGYMAFAILRDIYLDECNRHYNPDLILKIDGL